MSETNQNLEKVSDGTPETKKGLVRKIITDPEVINKMKRLSSLYADEIPEGAKEIDIISFFFNRSFEIFLSSGEIERKVEEIKK